MEARDITLHQKSVSSMDNNCYLLCVGKEALLIDAADDALGLLQWAKDLGVTITAVLTTHRHHDHVRALAEVLAHTKAKHYAPYLDAPALPADVDEELHDGDTVAFAGHHFPIHILRGHTPGGAALVAQIPDDEGKQRVHIFSGDSLFPGGVGKTASESEFERLFHDVKEKLFDNYPDTAIVHPGHGDRTTLGQERPHLEEWWQRRW